MTKFSQSTTKNDDHNLGYFAKTFVHFVKSFVIFVLKNKTLLSVP